MGDMVRREVVYLWYYFSIQFEQIFRYWVLGMVLGSVISVFFKDNIHRIFRSLGEKKLGIAGIFAAGDCTGRPYQYAKSVGEGNVAAHSVVQFLAENK